MRIDAELTEIAGFGGFFAIAHGVGGQGWRPIERCYAEGYADLIEATAARYRTTDLRVSASTVQLSHASRLWSPVLACAVVHGMVPVLDGLQRADDSPALRLPTPEGVRLRGDWAETLYRVVVEEQLEPFADGLRVKVAPGLLYGNIASALVAAARALYSVEPQLRDDATRLARSLLQTGRLTGTGTVKHNLAFRRRSCCLYYRVADGAKCFDCGLVKR